MATIQEQLESFVLSASELRDLNPDWSDVMVEEWLNLIRNFVLLASSSDIIQIQVDQNTTNIASNLVLIGNNTTAIVLVASNLNDHELETTAHGSNGDIVGFLDLATTLVVGLVKEAVAVSDGVDSSVSVSSPNATAAPATYDQTDAQTAVTLVNEIKNDVNTLVSDVNLINAQFNDLLARLRTSGVLDV